MSGPAQSTIDVAHGYGYGYGYGGGYDGDGYDGEE